jgi:hypothetical protein
MDGSAAPSSPHRLTFSVIVEWENAKLSELERARSMLASLAAQTRQLGPSDSRAQDLVVLYDPQAIAPEPIRQLLDESMGEPPCFSEIKVLPATGKAYYELKNHGATLTDADILVFLDSDVIPDPGWLQRLLSPIASGESDVVGGNTYIRPESLYTKSFALFWFFPPMSERDELRPTHHFFANNVAFRRALFEAHPFPQRDTFRGQCAALAVELDRAGIPIHVHEGARVSHPPPNGPRHFVSRALCAGYDTVLTRRMMGSSTTARMSLGLARRELRESWSRISRRGKTVGLSPTERALATGIAGSYHALACLGEFVTRAAPGVIPRHFPI